MTHLQFLRQEILSHWRLCREEFSLSRSMVSLFLLFFPSREFSSSAVCVSTLRVLLEGVQKDTVWNEHSSDLPDTPDTANQITSPQHIGHYNWLVGGKYERWGFKWREKGREGGSEKDRGEQGSGAKAPLCTLIDPLPRTGQEISRTKASCHLCLTASFWTKLLSADWQTEQSLREVACCNLVLSHIPDVSGERGKRACPEPSNRKWVRMSFLSLGRASAVAKRGLQTTWHV